MKYNISVVVPVYNTKAKYLEQCLFSIFGQTYQPYEVIIVNDGSTRKETLNVLKMIEEQNLKNVKIIHQENKKISGALNTGIRNMKGNWWAGCASDDLWFPNKLEEQVKFAKKHPEARVIYANWVMIDENGFFIRQVNEVEFFSLRDQQLYLCQAYFATWSNMLVHKEVFKKIGLFNEAFPTSEDYEMNIRIAQYYLFYKVPKNLMMYRVHPEQLSESEWGWKGEKGKEYTIRAQKLAKQLFWKSKHGDGNE